MSNILQASITLQGTRPLLWHVFGPDSIPLEKREKSGVPGNDPEEWKRTYLVTKEGRLYLEPTYIFGCIRDGAKYTSRKRGTLQPFVSATLQIVDDRVFTDRHFPDPLLPDPELPVYLDVRSVKNPATRARNVRYRVAAATGWHVSCSILWDKTIVSRGEMEAALIDAGRLVGLGDGRAIGFGRFSVECFNAQDTTS